MDFMMDAKLQSSANTSKKTIYLIRHGETEFNRLGIVQGSGVDSELNETGRMQARRFYDRYQHLPFERIYTSRLVRTRQSVEQFLEKGIPHTPLAELNEIGWGEYEGRQSREIWKEHYLKMVEEWRSGNLEYRVPGGESPLELQERQKGALQEILSCREELLLICMHGRAMKSFLCLMLGIPLHRMDEFEHMNLGLYLLSYENAAFQLHKTNCTRHLEVNR